MRIVGESRQCAKLSQSSWDETRLPCAGSMSLLQYLADSQALCVAMGVERKMISSAGGHPIRKSRASVSNDSGKLDISNIQAMILLETT